MKIDNEALRQLIDSRSTYIEILKKYGGFMEDVNYDYTEEQYQKLTKIFDLLASIALFDSKVNPEYMNNGINIIWVLDIPYVNTKHFIKGIFLDINVFYFTSTLPQNMKRFFFNENECFISALFLRAMTEYIEKKSVLEVAYKKVSGFKTYIMMDNRTLMYKIGRSKSPSYREVTLQSENPLIELIAICEEDIERKLHKFFKDCRIRGEWFRFTEGQVNKIISEYGFKRVRGII